MSPEAIHVVQAFKQTEDGIVAIAPKHFQTAGIAKAAARILSHSHLGVIAWSCQSDPHSGRYGEPEELLLLGEIPNWFDHLDGLADPSVVAQRARAA